MQAPDLAPRRDRRAHSARLMISRTEVPSIPFGKTAARRVEKRDAGGELGSRRNSC
jgi:hypothetical protein